MNAYYFWFGVFTFVFYLAATDDSVSYAINLVSKLIRFEYEKQKWWIWHNPRMPWAKFLMWRRALQIAKKLDSELKR